MRNRPLAVALLLALAPVASAAPVRAQAAADDPTTDMARARFKEGVAYYDKGQFEQARAAFLQAYALKKHPAVLLNLAWSSLKSGHTLEAERYFKQFLVEGKDISDKQRADANDGLNQAHAKLGRIEVAAAAGTEVTVDGDKVGTAPLSDPIPVEPGAHTVKFRGSDGATDTDSVTVLAGEKAIARFAKTAAAATPVATPPPGDTTQESPAPAPTEQPDSHPAPSPQAEAHASSSHSIFAAPSNMVPVYVGGAVTLVGIGLAIGMLVAKQGAQNNANDTRDAILKGAASDHIPTSQLSCSPPSPASLNGLTEACSRFNSDNSDVNTDATIGNVALGVAGVALVGTLFYWAIADKHGDNQATATSRTPLLVPTVGARAGGLSMSGSF